MNEFTINMDKYTDKELDCMCIHAENIELKKLVDKLEEDNLKLKNTLLELSAQMEGMIYED